MSGAASAIGVTGCAGELFAELCECVRRDGANTCRWPGSTIYRFTRPSRPRWDQIGPLSLVVIAQSGRASTAVGGRRLADGINYLVATSDRHLECEVLQASHDHPVLCLVLAIDPQLVRSLVTSVRDLGMTVAARDSGCGEHTASVADTDMASTASRFLRSLSLESDRRVLAPLLLQELVYRVLRGEQGRRLMALAAHRATTHPVGAAVAYINAHLAEPLTVDVLAAHVCMSSSSFSRAFRETTGCGPYQYVKEARLNRARQLLDDGRCTVADAARQVGYVSVSNFIKAFRRRFGATPGDYASAHPFRHAC